MDTKLTLVLAAISMLLASTMTESFAQVPEETYPCIIDGCNVGEPIGKPKYLDRAEFTWNLFYKMLIAAFVVGAVVQGTLVFVTFRFRERKQKEARK